MTDDEMGKRAAELANTFESIATGQPAPAVVLALAMMVGVHAAQADRPDIDRALRAFGRAARDAFHHHRKRSALRHPMGSA